MKKCILYGAASIGNLAKKSLEKCGFEILGYIDKRAFEMSSYNELPVWGLDNVPTEYVNSNTIIYIAVKNVFEHERIVLDLAERGFSSIVYKPYNVLIGIGSAEEERISAIYDKLFEGKFKENFNTFDLHIRKENILHDYGMVHRDCDMITAYIPRISSGIVCSIEKAPIRSRTTINSSRVHRINRTSPKFKMPCALDRTE